METNLIAKLKENPIKLINKNSKYLTLKYIGSLAPNKKIVVCDSNIGDFFVEKDAGGNALDQPILLEGASRLEIGFQKDNILNIDHHFPISDFSRNISSTNLAISYVKKNGSVDKDTLVVINHTDCDSILSSAIMRGILPPDDKFGIAAIAADHTGEENEIGDLLNALDDDRNIELSLRNLELLLNGAQLEPRAKELLKKRENERERAKVIAKEKMKITPSGNIYYAELDKEVESELMPPLLPKAKIIVLITPAINEETGKPAIEVKARLGLAAPEGIFLKKFMQKVDPIWSGRWNAGSDKRNGGQNPNTFDLETFMSSLDKEATAYLDKIEKHHSRAN